MTSRDRKQMRQKGRVFYRQFGFVERPNDELGAGMTQWIARGE